MKLSTTQENLAQGLSLVSHVSSRNVNLPILQNVLVQANEKGLRLSSTNLDLAISCTVRGKIEVSGEITVPARLFAEYINLLSHGQVDLELVKNTITVRSGKTETHLNGIPAAEFPVIPRVGAGKQFKLAAGAFRKALDSVLFAVAQTEARPELTGVFFSFHGLEVGALTLAATDSYRLAEAIVPLEKGSSGDAAAVIIPGRALIELGRMLAAPGDALEESGALTVTVAENQVQFEIGGAELQSRIIEGTYPEYRQIIPAAFQTEAALPRAEFVSAIKAASLFTKTGLNDVRLEFAAKKPLVVKSQDAQTGEHRAEVAGEVSGNQNHVVVNYKYLLDGLNAMDDDEMRYRLIDAANPCLVTPKDPAEKYLYLVMPIKQ